MEGKGKSRKKSQRKKRSSLFFPPHGGWREDRSATPHSLPSLNKLKPQNRALRSEQDSCGLRGPRARPCPLPPTPLPHPQHPQQGPCTRGRSRRGWEVSLVCPCPCLPPHCRASSPMEGEMKKCHSKGKRGGEGWYRGPVLRSLPAPSGLAP